MAYDPKTDGAVRDPAVQKMPRPKDAATLILVRRDRGSPEMLMGQRHAGHSFMPNKFVFPGGRLERSDYHAPAASELRADVHARLSIGCDPKRARALALAAIRETFEETGLALGRPHDQAAIKRAGEWGRFLATGLAPSLDVLEFIARAITPPYRPKRFDARFFMADAHHLTGADLDALAGSGELLTLRWVTTKDAAHLDLPHITQFIVGEIEARLTKPDTPRPVPVTRYKNGKSVIEHLPL